MQQASSYMVLVVYHIGDVWEVWVHSNVVEHYDIFGILPIHKEYQNKLVTQPMQAVFHTYDKFNYFWAQ